MAKKNELEIKRVCGGYRIFITRNDLMALRCLASLTTEINDAAGRGRERYTNQWLPTDGDPKFVRPFLEKVWSSTCYQQARSIVETEILK